MAVKKLYQFPLRLGCAAAVFAFVLAMPAHFAMNYGYQAKAYEPDTEESESETEITAGAENETMADNDPLSYASSYEEVYDALLNLYSFSGTARAADNSITLYNSSVAESNIAVISLEDAAVGEILPEEEAASADYSSTNIQVAGVDEGDVVKTDGSYIYILRSDASFAIIDLSEDESKVISITSLADANSPDTKEMYVSGDSLSIITSEYQTTLTEGEDGAYYTGSVRMTMLYTYDITDRSNPCLTGKVSQEGYFSDSRKVGDHIYLFSTWYPNLGSSYADSNIAPLLNDNKAEPSCFYLPGTLTSSQCLIISSIDTANPSEFTDNKVLVSGGNNFYVSDQNIYIINENYRNSNTVTEITKFHYEDGVITGVAAASVTGFLNNSFSMSEYDGNLRLVTTYYGDDLAADAVITDWSERNALYILDESLNQLSVIPDLAKGEMIKSARFLGNTGYFVTFKKTDPLFSVDLSDPENPQILGELKISGFSSYLHFYGDNLLLGLGYEADESTGITTGLKLSMFDISDPSDVQETAKYVIPGITWCESLDNYKSILVNPAKNLIGFYYSDRFLLFSYDEEQGFVQEMIYDFMTDNLTGKANSRNMRGLYVNDTLYLAGETFTISFDMNEGFSKKQILTF